MKKRSILAACLMSSAAVPAIAASDTAPVTIVADDVAVPYGAEIIEEPHVPVTAADEERWEQPYGPSYDCETAKGVADLTVCSDPVLSRMDLEVTTLHRNRLREAYVGDRVGPNGRPSFEHGSGKLVPSVPEPALVGAAGADVYRAIPAVPSRDELEDEQRRWLRARDNECDLDFDFHSEIGVHYEAVPCLIAYYAERIVELDSGMRERTGRRVLDVLADVGIVALDDMELDLGNVRIDLPRVLPVTSAGMPSPEIPHPACIDALTSANAPSSIRRAACRDGTVHLPLALDTWFEEGQKYVTYIPWHPGRWGQRGDRSGYRVVGALEHGRTLIHVVAESTGAGRTTVGTFLAVVLGLRTGETVEVEHRIVYKGLEGFCEGGIDEVEIANPDTLRLASIIPAETLVTLFDWFPEQLPGVTESERRRLRALKDSGELDVAMSIIGSICIGRAHYDHDLESGHRTLTDVSVKVTESGRADVAHSPALACLFDFLLERHPEMPVMYRPTQLHELLSGFIDTCEVPGA